MCLPSEAPSEASETLVCPGTRLHAIWKCHLDGRAGEGSSSTEEARWDSWSRGQQRGSSGMPREEHARRRITRVPLVTHPDLQSENEGLTSRMAVTGRASEDRLLEKAMRKLAKATFVAHGLSVIKGVVIPEKRLNLGRIEHPRHFK